MRPPDFSYLQRFTKLGWLLKYVHSNSEFELRADKCEKCNDFRVTTCFLAIFSVKYFQSHIDRTLFNEDL
ncbi:hypothetical protein X777_09487 [Ooceraea biroi]|uniref:Uncharacterized protein n=1 Tax=Ooceraea biroi TaxID=2015173 RepID=A0A026W7W2_OOCBI|nr:hypothetical protein X777_09487 [Ooceraea biroi]